MARFDGGQVGDDPLEPAFEFSWAHAVGPIRTENAGRLGRGEPSGPLERAKIRPIEFLDDLVGKQLLGSMASKNQRMFTLGNFEGTVTLQPLSQGA